MFSPKSVAELDVSPIIPCTTPTKGIRSLDCQFSQTIITQLIYFMSDLLTSLPQSCPHTISSQNHSHHMSSPFKCHKPLIQPFINLLSWLLCTNKNFQEYFHYILPPILTKHMHLSPNLFSLYASVITVLPFMSSALIMLFSEAIGTLKTLLMLCQEEGTITKLLVRREEGDSV